MDRYRWCNGCRAVVIRRATLAARIIGALALAAAATWVFAVVAPGPRSLIVWLVLLGAVYFIVYKITQRVAFEIIRSRGVPPPEA